MDLRETCRSSGALRAEFGRLCRVSEPLRRPGGRRRLTVGENDLAAGGSDPREPMTGGVSLWLISNNKNKINLIKLT